MKHTGRILFFFYLKLTYRRVSGHVFSFFGTTPELCWMENKVLGESDFEKNQTIYNKQQPMNRSNRKTQPRNPFTFTKGRTRITGDSNKKSLLILCYLRELRWILFPITAILWGWLRHWLGG